MNERKFFLPALILPILALIILTFFKAYSLQSGIRFTLPVSGYDPIDPISGHYVTYRVDYAEPACQESKNLQKESCICLKLDFENNNHFVPNCDENELETCDAFLKGKCRYGRFEAGIEKYFISEEKAEEIDKTVRKGKSKIKISVKKDGSALVEDLILID